MLALIVPFLQLGLPLLQVLEDGKRTLHVDADAVTMSHLSL
jgi:hypothetical protein